jgi:hypothetical protein
MPNCLFGSIHIDSVKKWVNYLRKTNKHHLVCDQVHQQLFFACLIPGSKIVHINLRQQHSICLFENQSNFYFAIYPQATLITYAYGRIVWSESHVIATTERRELRSHVHFKMLEKIVVLSKHNEIAIKFRKHSKYVSKSHASLELNGTMIPIEPDNVVYTIESPPPGINVVFWRVVGVSPR